MGGDRGESFFIVKVNVSHAFLQLRHRSGSHKFMIYPPPSFCMSNRGPLKGAVCEPRFSISANVADFYFLHYNKSKVKVKERIKHSFKMLNDPNFCLKDFSYRFLLHLNAK